jgi:hypothetical protein
MLAAQPATSKVPREEQETRLTIAFGGTKQNGRSSERPFLRPSEKKVGTYSDDYIFGDKEDATAEAV